jgi:hypothetical protein
MCCVHVHGDLHMLVPVDAFFVLFFLPETAYVGK